MPMSLPSVVGPSHPGTLVAPRGWETLADAADFYPDDLPADWRLTYFANALPAVLLPWSAWHDAADAVLQGWCADVHAGFRFFLEVPRLPVAEADTLAAVARASDALAPVLGGWVAPTATVAAGVLVACSGPAAGAPPTAGAVVVPDELQGDWRAASAWLRGLAAATGTPPRLLVLPTATSSALLAWQQLVALLGWAPGAAGRPAPTAAAGAGTGGTA